VYDHAREHSQAAKGTQCSWAVRKEILWSHSNSLDVKINHKYFRRRSQDEATFRVDALSVSFGL
jgi:hypothetical protein